MKTNPLLAQFADQPVMLAPEMAGQVKVYLDSGAAHPDFAKMMGEMAAADDGFWPAADDWRARYRPYNVVDGVLQIPVRGVLLHDFPFAARWATGYDYIWRAYERGMDDGSVRGIALLIHSPGGLVAGNQDLVDKMYARRDEKPVRAFAHEAAYSAAYNIASVAPHIAVGRTGGVGSIGVMTTHVSWAKFNENMGLDYTFIFAGKHKVDGNSEEPLSAEAKERIQARIDELYDVFVSSVARNRDMDEKAVRDTEALTFTATQAVSNGLADSIGSLDDAVATFVADLSTTNGEETMSNTTDNAATVDQAAHEQAVTAARAEGHAAGMKEGAAAAQARISEILGSEEAKGRDAQALYFATKTDMPAEQAIGALAAAPKASQQEQATGSTFDAAMSNGNPDVGGNGGESQQEPEANDPASLKALAASVGLKGFA